MKNLLVASMLVLIVPGVSAQCLDYDTVMPSTAELPDVGEIIDVESRDHWLYALEKISEAGRWLQIFDLSDPTDPQLATQIGIPGRSNKILARDGRLYILTRPADSTSLYIFTNQPPAFPTLLGSLVLAADVNDFDVEGQVVVLAAGASGLMVVDAADPTAMSVVGGFTPPADQGESRTVDLRGDRVLLGLGTYFPDAGHLHWLDVSDPSSPVPLGDVSAGREIFEVHLLADQPEALITGDESMAWLDLSDPAMPVIGEWRVSAGEHLVVAGDLALQCNQATGAAMLVDIGDPAAHRWLAPRERVILDAAPFSSGLALARGPDGLAVAELTGPEVAPIAGVAHADVGTGSLVATDMPGIVLGVRRLGTLNDVQIVDVSEPTAPRLRGGYAVSSPRTAASQGQQAMVLTYDEGHLLDLSDPDAPVLLATWASPAGAIGLLWVGDLLHMAVNSAGYVIMDASDPEHPVELSRIDAAPAVRSILPYDDSTMLLACSSGGLRVVDISDPSAPIIISELTTGGYVESLALSGSRCFVGGFFDSDLVEIDLTDPSAPEITEVTQVAGGVSGMRVHEGRLWARGASVINIFDVGAPGHLEQIGRLGLFTSVGGLVPAGEFMTTSCGHVMTLRPPCLTTTAVHESVVPVAVAPMVVAPNPANPRTVISFRIAAPGPSRLDIYDLAGRRVRAAWRGELEAGRHSFTWDGRDAAGRPLASGTYLARLVAGGAARTAKVSLVR